MISVNDNGKTSVTCAIRNLAPGAEFVSNLITNSIKEWLSPDITQPSQAEIDVEMTRLLSVYDAQEYARNRATEYPPIGDQLDALYHGGAFPKEMSDKLKAVKDAHPKPTE